jgi:phosphate-selective porin OprO/OprP
MKMKLRMSFVAALMTGAASSAMAQTADERIAALEARIAGMSGELAELKAATSKADQDLKKQVTTAQATQLTLSGGRPMVATADGTQKFAIRAVGQFDAAAYDEHNHAPTANDLNSGTNFRRARLSVEGSFGKDWTYNLTGEFGGSGAEAAQLNQAYVEYAGWKPFGPKTLVRLRIGGWPTPTGLEDATHYTEGLFLERAAVAEMVRNIAGGDARSGVGALVNGERWYASAVLTGAVVGATAEFDEQTGYLARVAFNPLGGKTWGLHLGANLQGVLHAADTGAGATETKILRLRERPELRVDGTRLVDTGNINADGVTAYGLELGGFYRNFQVSGEAFQVDVDRTGAFDPSFGGWYVQGAWTLTGESHLWTSASGGFKGVKPSKAFDGKGGLGAWELAARYSVLDLDDAAGARGAATPAGGIRGGEQKITTFGLNWYPNAVFRFQAQYQQIVVDRLSATGGPAGENVDTVSLRSQFSF